MTCIKGALEEIKSLEPGEKLVFADIAAKYAVNRTTLAKKHKQIRTPKTLTSRSLTYNMRQSLSSI
jgi:hypothetical protein